MFAVLANMVQAALRLTPGCRLRSLRSLRPTLGPSRRLPGAANGAPARRVRQPETLAAHATQRKGQPSLAAQFRS